MISVFVLIIFVLEYFAYVKMPFWFLMTSLIFEIINLGYVIVDILMVLSQ